MEITLAFLLVALAAYTLFGGADFGGGVLEASLWRHPALQKKLQATLAPVWEANHVWLIAVIVILFVGFPAAYARLCTLLFVPLSLVLLGIILRGAFFTFRKYDPEPGMRQRGYSWLFRVSSLLTPLMFGFIVAALLRPFLPTAIAAEEGFAAVYIYPWTNTLGLLCGLFVSALFGYLAAVFFFGELRDAAERAVLRTRILGFFAATFVSGGGVLLWGAHSGTVDLRQVLSPLQVTVQAVALLGVVWLLRSLRAPRIWQMRLAAGLQVLAILAGWFGTQFPVFLRFTDGSEVTVHNSAAPQVTLFWLNLGLLVVLSLVVPLMAYLYKVFSARHQHTEV